MPVVQTESADEGSGNERLNVRECRVVTTWDGGMEEGLSGGFKDDQDMGLQNSLIGRVDSRLVNGCFEENRGYYTGQV